MLPAILFQAFKQGSLRDWRVSVEGERSIAATKAACGFRLPGTFWIEAEWPSSDFTHSLQASRLATDETATIRFDGRAFTGRMTIQPTLSLRGLGVKVMVQAEGMPGVRLDGRLGLKAPGG
jgi:hypothetical protein